MSAMRAYLVLSVLLGWGCIVGPQWTKAQQAGTPLSNQEYRQFFKFLRITLQASTACHLRELYGCQNSLVQTLDKYENHGVIPQGPVCSEMPGNPFFPNFCTFSFYRCIKKKYFLKRIACPGENSAKLNHAPGTNDITTSSDAVSSRSVNPQPLYPTSPTSTHPAGSSPDMEVSVTSSFLPAGPEATEVTASGQQLPSSDIEDLLLRLLDSQVQSSLQTLKLLLSVGKAVKEEELQEAAARLLEALNNANVAQ
ncbi:acrosin-binding protein-like [Empidonax traillii]|uniref:acrosin-binding protein-like n=1 Tax=Empidonax traillii TaxID=164674 RepID=UPI000FFD5495|nr:acrosin-binding protein-like [Empidonax traillii]